MTTHREALERLVSELPNMGCAATPDDQIRAALVPVLERALEGAVQPARVETTVLQCPNCGAECLNERTPYCSDSCRDTGAFVRQFRKAVREETIWDSERQAGMGQALWVLQGGGYPRRQTMVPQRVITKVIERDGGVCSVCGAPATEIDHTGSG